MHQRANGKAESAVKITKPLLRKTHKEGGDPYEAMLEQRNTPHQDTGRSPAEMMFKRRTHSFLPSMSSSPKDTLVKEKREARKCSVKNSHDWRSQKLSEVDVEQSVFFQHSEGRNWKLGILCPSTYQVSGPDGAVDRKNRVHMRPTKVTQKACNVSPGILSHITDVTPLTLPEETPPAYNPPTDPPVENNQPCSIREKI